MTLRRLRKQVEERLVELIEGREVYQRKPWTFVLLQVQEGGRLVEIFDFTKVMYPDEWNAERGAELAEQKAIAAFAKKLVAQYGSLALERMCHGQET